MTHCDTSNTSVAAQAPFSSCVCPGVRFILTGSGTDGPTPLAEAAAAFDSLLRQVAGGQIHVDITTAPLADVEKTWTQPDNGRRVVYVP